MNLENNYYKLIDIQNEGRNKVFYIALLPDCKVYHGHFPSNPVCPGVYNIQTIKECAEHLIGKKLHISNIRRCRLTTVATPITCSNLEVKINLSPIETGYSIIATIYDTKHVYMNYEGEMIL